jgi:hypothetical protein
MELLSEYSDRGILHQVVFSKFRILKVFPRGRKVEKLMDATEMRIIT